MAEKQIELNPALPYTNHGNTVAAWVLCGLVTIGFIIGSVGFNIANMMILIVGCVVMAVGIVAGVALKAAGYGQGGAKTKSHH